MAETQFEFLVPVTRCKVPPTEIGGAQKLGTGRNQESGCPTEGNSVDVRDNFLRLPEDRRHVVEQILDCQREMKRLHRRLAPGEFGRAAEFEIEGRVGWHRLVGQNALTGLCA